MHTRTLFFPHNVAYVKRRWFRKGTCVRSDLDANIINGFLVNYLSNQYTCVQCISHRNIKVSPASVVMQTVDYYM